LSHRPRKRFGQNFLHDANIIARIVGAIAPKTGECLVEIGPGLGAMTRPLLRSAGRLNVIELDRDLIPALERRCAGAGTLIVHQGDVLDFDLSSLAPQPGSLRVIGNLPYNISTPILFHLLAQREWIQDMHFMLQREVVDRMAADPGSRDYGRLSVMVQYHCQVVPLFGIGPGAFRPQPKVESSLVRLVPRPCPAGSVDEASLDAVVRAAFSQRRKKLSNTLKPLFDRPALVSVGVNPDARAETLALADFVALANALAR
jgi:16S rRNA (adenine1518-N6/adenine1519-N6)-dimethyltransferase